MEDPNPLVAGRGLARLRAAGIDVRLRAARGRSTELNIGFVSRMTRGRPWVRMKVAASLDGRTGAADGLSQWITGAAAARRARVARAGVGAADRDRHGARRTIRDSTCATAVDTPRQPWRVLSTAASTCRRDARIVRNVRDGKRLLVVGAVDDPARVDRRAPTGCETLLLPNGTARSICPRCSPSSGAASVNELHVEAGGKLNGSLLREGCVDELLAYLAPSLLGPGQPMIELPPLDVSTARRAELS